MFSKTKGQSSFEYVTIVAISLALLLPSIYFFYNSTQETQDETLISQINRISKNTLSLSRSIYYCGDSCKDFIEFTIPDKIVNITIQNKRELIINYYTTNGLHSLVEYSSVDISGTPITGNPNLTRVTPVDFHGGYLKLRLYSTGYEVNIITVN